MALVQKLSCQAYFSLCQCLHRVLNDPRFEQPYVPIEELATARPPVIPAGRQRVPRTPSACAPDTREIDLDTHGPVFEFVRHAQAPSADPPPVLVYTIHDGDRAPRGLVDRLGKVPADGLRERFHEGRDWGANAVARALSEALGLGGYHRANIARCFVDYGRLPGVSDRNVGRLQTRSISGWLASHLTKWEDREVLLSVHDVRGRRLVVLADGHHEAGAFVKRWDGRDAHGRPVASGVYFACLQAGDLTATRKMVLLR